MGRVHYCEKDYWPHNTCLYVTDFLGNAPLFVYYKLAELDLARYNSGSAQPSLNRNYIYGMRLSVPEPRIQNRIAKTISGFDKKIDLNRRINQTLEAMAQAIFKSWFVDFDPVKAKIAAKERWLAQHPSPFGRGAGGEGKLPPPLLTFARDNRRNATDAESLMWRLLRGRQLGTKFRRQHPIASYILDFYCHEHRLAIELDGGQHYTPDGLAADAARTEILKQHGITVMRFSNREVLLETEAALEKIWRALTPTPLPEGEGLETVMLRAAMCAISGKSDAELDQLKTLPSPFGRGAGGEGEQLSAYDALAATAALFPDEMEESGLGDIPRGWGHKSLAQLTEKIGSGATPRGGKEVYLEEGVALIRSQNVYDSLFVWEGLARISDEAAVQLKGVTIQEDDVLLNITGASILRTCVVEPDALPARVNQHVAIIRAKTGVPPRFIHLHLLRPDIKSYLLGLNAGASREAITKAHIESLALLTPGPELLAAFQTATDPLFRQVQLFGQQMRVLGELRDTLLPKLLSGELPVAGLNSNLDEATQ